MLNTTIIEYLQFSFPFGYDLTYIQQLQTQFDVDLLDKMNVTFYSGDFIAHKSLLDFRKMAKNRSVSRDTIVFNNLVTTKEDYLEHWEVPAHESWHNRFLS